MSAARQPPGSSGPALEVKGLTCGHGTRPLISGLDLSLAGGKALAVVGPNGAGKSTLLRALAGQHPLDSGRVMVQGVDITAAVDTERARLVAMLPQADRGDGGLRVEELVALGRTPHLGLWGHLGPDDRAAVERALVDCGLIELRERPLDRLSGGERQRARIAMTLAQQSPLLLLDEPANHLDLRRRHQLFELLGSLRQERQLALVMVLHDLQDAFREADEVLLLAEGKAGQVAPSDPDRRQRLADAFGVPTHRIPDL